MIASSVGGDIKISSTNDEKNTYLFTYPSNLDYYDKKSIMWCLKVFRMIAPITSKNFNDNVLTSIS